MKFFLFFILFCFVFGIKKSFIEPKEFDQKVNCIPKPKGDVYKIISYTLFSEIRENIQFGIVRFDKKNQFLKSNKKNHNLWWKKTK